MRQDILKSTIGAFWRIIFKEECWYRKSIIKFCFDSIDNDNVYEGKLIPHHFGNYFSTVLNIILYSIQIDWFMHRETLLL